MLIKFSGPTLSLVMLPASAPQPSVIDGKTLVVMPVDPCGAGVFTSTRNEGIRKPYSRMRASSLAWITDVWPKPPKRRMASQASTAAAKSATKYTERTGESFSADSGCCLPTPWISTTMIEVSAGISYPRLYFKKNTHLAHLSLDDARQRRTSSARLARLSVGRQELHLRPLLPHRGHRP